MEHSNAYGMSMELMIGIIQLSTREISWKWKMVEV